MDSKTSNLSNAVLKAIEGRRSVRAYGPDTVSRELVEKLIHSAVMAPSACNRQPWQFTIVSNAKKIGEIGKKVVEAYNASAPAIGRQPFYNAPLLILISAEKDYKWAKIDVGIAAQNMMLAAHSLGLGSCYIGFALALNSNKAVLEELGIPAGNEIIAALVFGYPDGKSKFNGRQTPRILKWIE